MGIVVISGKTTLLFAAIAEIPLTGVIIRWPLVGVIGVIFVGTSLQIFGSEYSTGLPLRLLADLREAERAAIRDGNRAQAELAVVLADGLSGFFFCAFLAHAKIVNILWILGGLAAALRRATLEPQHVFSSQVTRSIA